MGEVGKKVNCLNKMAQLCLVLSGSGDPLHDYMGLTYVNQDGNYLAGFSHLTLVDNRDQPGKYRFAWHHLFGEPASLRLVNENRIPSGLTPAQLPLSAGQSWYLALERPRNLVSGTQSISRVSIMDYYPLKYRNGQFIFANENPSVEDTVRVVVPVGSSLRTNDVETRNYLKIGDVALADIPLIKCSKVYLSPLEWSQNAVICDELVGDDDCSCSRSPSRSSSRSCSRSRSPSRSRSCSPERSSSLRKSSSPKKSCSPSSSRSPSRSCSQSEDSKRTSDYSKEKSPGTPGSSRDQTGSRSESRDELSSDLREFMKSDDEVKTIKVEKSKKISSQSSPSSRPSSSRSSPSSLNSSSRSSSSSSSQSGSSDHDWSTCSSSGSSSTTSNDSSAKPVRGAKESEANLATWHQKRYRTLFKEFPTVPSGSPVTPGTSGTLDKSPNKSLARVNEEKGHDVISGGYPLKRKSCSRSCPKICPSRSCPKPITGPFLVPDPNANILLIGPHCVPNCQGKKCSSDNGCGKPCGCPDGKVCNPKTGECDNPPPNPLCTADSPCGSANGLCAGHCPSGSTCARDANGRARCVPIPTNTYIWWLIAFIVIIFLIGLFLYFGYELYSASSQPKVEVIHRVICPPGYTIVESRC